MLDGDARRIIELDGDEWQFGAVDHTDGMPDDRSAVDEWLPAQVPGDVRNDLLNAGRIPDPYYGLDLEASNWVEERDWWYRRTITLPPATLHAPWLAHLIFEGIDYISAVYWNGEKLAEHEGMFSRQIFDVTSRLQTENELAVRIRGAAYLPKRKLTRKQAVVDKVNRLLQGKPAYPDRTQTVKCQMGFGWDFAPVLRTMGIWDDVSLVLTRGLYVAELGATSRRSEEGIDLVITLEIDAPAPAQVAAGFTLLGDGFIMLPLRYGETLALPAGRSHHTISLRVPEPVFWQPWEQGHPLLYRLEVTLKEAQSGRVCDRVRERVGLVTAAFEDGKLIVNRQQVRIRGANWVPADAMPGRVRPQDYAALIRAAKAVGVNMLRVWGGGLREKRAFYDICDQEGMLVWQELPFACVFLGDYPEDAAFLTLAGDESSAIVRRLRSHPSIALWCGGNEYSAARNGPLVRTLQAAVCAEDTTRAWLPVSPGAGDSHNWRVWHRHAPLRDYRKDVAQTVSEFGVQAIPNPESLACFLPPEHAGFPDSWWEFHHAELANLWRYCRPFFAPHERVDAHNLSKASQRAQAYALQVMIEHMRRREGNVMFWQLNEPWPAISWSVLDYFRHPKLGYHWLRALYAPLMVSMNYSLRTYEPGMVLEGSIWIINDTPNRIDGCRMEVVALPGPPQASDMNAHIDPGVLKPGLPVLVRVVEVEPYEVCRLQNFKWRLPQYDDEEMEGWMIQLRLWRQGQLLAINSYDLTFGDTSPMPFLARLRAWAVDWLLQ